MGPVPDAPDVIVVGAGLTGLSAAFHLHHAGAGVCVLEKAPRPGGVIGTETVDGYQLEWGPHTFLSTATEINRLCEALELAPLAADARARKRYVYHGNRLCPVPTDPLSFLASPLLSPGAKLRLMMEPFQKSANDEDETVAHFARRRLGEEVLQNLLGPFLSGVYAGDPERLSLPAVFPSLARLERESGSLLKGLLRERGRRDKNRPPYALLSFEGGMGRLPEALAETLPRSAIQCNTTVTAIDRDASGYRIGLENGESLHAPAVILTAPAEEAAGLLETLLPDAAAMLRQIPYAPIGVVHLGFKRSEAPYPLDGFGFLVPRRAGIDTLGVIWASSLFPGRAPQGHVLLSAFIGGALQPEIAGWSEGQLTERVVSDYSRIFDASLSPSFSRTRVIRRAIPQYVPGHLARIRRLEALLADQEGLVLAGNYLDGVSVNDCVRQGERAAQKALASRRVHTG